jgi:hypothetical protein
MNIHNAFAAQKQKITALDLLVLSLPLVYFGPHWLFLAWFMKIWIKRLSHWLILAVLSILIAIQLYADLPAERTLVSVIYVLWFRCLSIVPLGSIAWLGWESLRVHIIEKPMDELLEEKTRLLQRRNDQLRKDAEKYERREPSPQAGYVRLGPVISGSPFDEGLGIEIHSNWAIIDRRLLNKHCVIFGRPGSGKTETLKRIIYELANHTEVSIFFVEGKGDLELCTDIVNILYQAGRGRTPLFKLGYGEQEDSTASVYDAFRGSSLEIHNRMLALIGVDEMVGDSGYYADQYRDIMQLVCGVSKPFVEPPRNLEELRHRVSKAWLEITYKDDLEELDTIKNDFDDKSIRGLQSRIRPLVREFTNYVDDAGFALEDVEGAVFSMRAAAVGDSSRRFLNMIVEDYKSFMGVRQARPAVLIIDEFGAFDNHNVEKLMTMGRKNEAGVILGTQDIATIKDNNLRQIILSTATTKIQMASDYPEEVAQLAGTKKRLEGGYEINSKGMTGDGTVRVQDTFRIDLEEVAKLRPGEAFIFRDRHDIKLKIKRVGEIQYDLEAVAAYKKPKQLHYTQVSSPPVKKKTPSIIFAQEQNEINAKNKH